MFLNKKSIIFIVLLLLSFNIFCKDENPKILSFNNIFLDGAVQRYIAIQELQDYTMPKPGWVASLGYDFFLSYSHSIQFMISSGHNVISGSNPLVRMLDIYPLSMGLGYAFSPNHRNWQWFSVGVSGGGGVYFSEISHYETVLNLVNQNMTTTNGSSYMFYGRLNLGVNFFDNKLKLCINAGIDCIKEIDGIIPIPVVEVGFRIYPVAAFRNVVRKPKLQNSNVDNGSKSCVISCKNAEIFNDTLDNIYTEINSLRRDIKGMQTEKITETEVLKAYKKGELINIYFNANSDELTKDSIKDLIEIGKYLEQYPEHVILVQGHSAPFETEKLQYQMGLNRANIVRNYLIENFNIANKRVKSESLGATQSGAKVPGKTNEEYKKYRMVQLKNYQGGNNNE